MNEQPDGRPDDAKAESPGSQPGPAPARPGHDDQGRPSLTTQVRRRRTDQAFFLRLRDVIAQNHKALERLGT
jgi:hypothetical protein